MGAEVTVLARAVIFDLDDTLYPRHAYVRSAFAAAALEIESMAGVPSRTVRRVLRAARAGREFQAVCRQFGLPLALVPRLVTLVRAHRPSIVLPPRSRAVLAAMRRSWRVGVLTNGDPIAQRNKVEALGLSPRVDAVVYAAARDARRGKPHPSAFRAVLDRLRVPAARAVFVGDDWKADILGARGCGLRAIYVSPRSAAPRPGVIRVRSLAQVPRTANALLRAPGGKR